MPLHCDKLPSITIINSFNRRHTQRCRQWISNPSSQTWLEAVYHLKKKWHSTRERNSKGRNPFRHACLSTSEKRAEANPVRPCGIAGLLYGTREQTGQSLRIIWQRKDLEFRTLGHFHTLSNIPRWDTPKGGRMIVWRKEAFCTWSEMLCCRALSGTQGTESREKSMVTRLVRTESMDSSFSAKKRRTLTECRRTNFSVCHGQPYK